MNYRLLLEEPIAVNKGQVVSGRMGFEANEKFSYFITLEGFSLFFLCKFLMSLFVFQLNWRDVVFLRSTKLTSMISTTTIWPILLLLPLR